MHRYLLFLLLSPLAPATEPAPQGPGNLEGVVTSVVASLLEHHHLTGSRLDDEVSANWFDHYLNTLDPMHMYFLKEDIDRFEAYRTTLDDNLHRARAQDLHPAYEIFAVYKQRVAERAHHAIELADDEYDFTLEESVDLERKDAPWPATKAEADELWRLYIKEQRLRGELWDREPADQAERIVERFEDQLQGIEEMESLDILETYLTALSEVHDPHSTYFKPASRDNFQIDLSNSVEGIGAVLRRDGEFTRVERLIPGGPASKSELLEGDKIIAVAQGAGEPVDIIDQRIDKVVKLIRGKKGSEVRLTIIPNGAPPNVTKVVPITRDRVQLQDALAKTEVHTVEGSGDIAVIDVPSFYAPVQGYGGVSRVSADVREQLEALDPDAVRAVVIDLRRNTGGSLAEAIDLSGLFIDRGPVVQVKGRRNEVEVYRDRDSGVSWTGPLVVLISPNSASASEIFAGAIKDYGRGLIVGSKQTHGKGTVQTIMELDKLLRGMDVTQDGGAGMLKLTQQQFYRVNGASTQGRGVPSDIQLPTPYEQQHTYEGEIDFAVKWDQVDPAPVKVVGDLSPVLDELKARSEGRVAADEDLQAIVKANAWRDAQDAQDGVYSLNLETRKREQAEMEALIGLTEGDEQAEDDAGTDADREERRDAILDEAVRIAADLAELG